MVGLAFAIALGILIAITVIAWLPEIIEALGGWLVVVVGIALLSLMIWAVSPLAQGLARLLGGGVSVAGHLGPRILFVIVAVIWCWILGRSLLTMARFIRNPSGDLPFATSGCVVTIVGFMFVIPLGLAEGARDPLLMILGRPFAVRLLLLSPLLIGLAILAVGVIVEFVVRSGDLARRAPRNR